MPEFILYHGSAEGARTFAELDGFTQGYVEAMFWLAKDESCQDADGNPDEHPHWSFDMLAPETLKEIIEICKDFQTANAADLEAAGNETQNGHDFWLTRNRHGAGFWDRGYPDEIGRRLTEAAHAYGEADLYVNDDLLYLQ